MLQRCVSIWRNQQRLDKTHTVDIGWGILSSALICWLDKPFQTSEEHPLFWVKLVKTRIYRLRVSMACASVGSYFSPHQGTRSWLLIANY